MKRRYQAPLRVEFVYRALEWVDYNVLGWLSRQTVWKRNALLDRYCQCEDCQKREETRAKVVASLTDLSEGLANERHRQDLIDAKSAGGERGRSDAA